MRPHALALILCLAVMGTSTSVQRGNVKVAPGPTVDLFRQTNIADVHLEFSEADYKALVPRGGTGWFGFGGGPGQSWLQGPEGTRNGFAASRGVQFSFVHGAATIDGHALKNIGVRYK